MIKILVKKENNKIKQILIKGHALYDDYGKDIVCASVSSIVITTVNAILTIDNNAIKYEEQPTFFIELLKDDDVINKLISNMLNLLIELQLQFPKNIEIL